MIKIKATISEFNEFHKYLLNYIVSDVKSGDLVKEYFITEAIDSVNKKIQKKMFSVEMSGKNYGLLSIAIETRELLALSIVFKRIIAHSYLSNIENSLLSQIPVEVIKIIKPNSIILTPYETCN